jgi:hypothetical protein
MRNRITTKGLGLLLATCLIPFAAWAADRVSVVPEQYYQLKEGEDLYTVALLCQVPMATLRDLNGLSSSEVAQGQRIRVPSGSLPNELTAGSAHILNNENIDKQVPSLTAPPLSEPIQRPVAVTAEPAPSVEAQQPKPVVAAVQESRGPPLKPETPSVEVGISREALLAAWGAPKGFMKSGTSEVLTFDRGLAYLTDGKIVAIKLRPSPTPAIRLAAK